MPIEAHKNLLSTLRGILILIVATGAASAQQDAPDPKDNARKIAELTALVERLQSRVEILESKLKSTDRLETASLRTESRPVVSGTRRAAAPSVASPSLTPAASPGVTVENAQVTTPPAPPFSLTNLIAGTTINVALDAYYSYNFNDPIGRVNLLRAYDPLSNAFSLSQASIILENAPDPANDKRFGLRLDLQYGQATETLQGSALNEPRPDVYRTIFQAYGTYVIPIGTGLTVDFGKWSSSLGIEGNYNKDQMNYSRSYLFDYLPYYHMGTRVNYKINDKIGFNYWLVNGTEQTEPFNGFKDELFGFTGQPTKTLTWTGNYYLGQEHPDVAYPPNDTGAGLPTFQGTPFLPIENPAKGKLHIFDSYINWAVTSRLSVATEGDYVIERLNPSSAPSHVSAGAGYLRYQLSPKWAVAGRAEYLSDRGGLFSGNTQALKEATLTLEQKLAEGFLLRAEWRRDSSNHPYFYTDTLGILKKEQNTSTVGVLWWFGSKQGAW